MNYRRKPLTWRGLLATPMSYSRPSAWSRTQRWMTMAPSRSFQWSGWSLTKLRRSIFLNLWCVISEWGLPRVAWRRSHTRVLSLIYSIFSRNFRKHCRESAFSETQNSVSGLSWFILPDLAQTLLLVPPFGQERVTSIETIFDLTHINQSTNTYFLNTQCAFWGGSQLGLANQLFLHSNRSDANAYRQLHFEAHLRGTTSFPACYSE